MIIHFYYNGFHLSIVFLKHANKFSLSNFRFTMPCHAVWNTMINSKDISYILWSFRGNRALPIDKTWTSNFKLNQMLSRPLQLLLITRIYVPQERHAQFLNPNSQLCCNVIDKPRPVAEIFFIIRKGLHQSLLFCTNTDCC